MVKKVVSCKWWDLPCLVRSLQDQMQCPEVGRDGYGQDEVEDCRLDLVDGDGDVVDGVVEGVLGVLLVAVVSDLLGVAGVVLESVGEGADGGVQAGDGLLRFGALLRRRAWKTECEA